MKLGIKLLLAIAVMMTAACTKNSSGSAGTQAPKSMNGGETGNGGDHIAQDFVISAQNGLKVLRQHADEYPFIDLKKIENAINSAKVTILDPHTSFHDAVRTAENFPKKNEIQIDGNRWGQVGDNVRKMALSLHEYLGLTGYEVNTYTVTSQLFSITNDQMEDPPSLDELDQSFDSVRDKDMKVLEFAKSLKPTLVSDTGKAITPDDCSKLFSEPYMVSAIICNARDTAPKLFLIEKAGVNPLNVGFTKIIRRVEKLNQKSYSTTIDYFLNSESTLVEIVTSYTLHDFRSVNMAVADKDWNAYEHDVRTDSQNNMVEEYMSMVAGDGNMGDGISETDLHRTDGHVQKKWTLSRAMIKDWQGFTPFLVNVDHNICDHISGNCWLNLAANDDDAEGGIGITYSYLNESFGTPDNYRSVTYRELDNGRFQKAGKYVANRRVYNIVSEANDWAQFHLISMGRGQIAIADFIDDSLHLSPVHYTAGYRFYYSTESFRAIDENSPYIESNIINQNGGYEIDESNLNAFRMTLGKRYFFKVGLVDEQGKLMYLQSNLTVDKDWNSISAQ